MLQCCISNDDNDDGDYINWILSMQLFDKGILCNGLSFAHNGINLSFVKNMLDIISYIGCRGVITVVQITYDINHSWLLSYCSQSTAGFK